MNILKHKLTRSQSHGLKRHGFNRNGFNRHGLSVIEVLTSIIVALIGVFGVLAMIPFSVKQTQSGLDQDAATSMARNALSNFEASGYKVVSGNSQLNWFINNAGAFTQVTADPGIPLICIDPLGLTEQIDPGLRFTFPFNSSLTGVPELEIPVANLVRPDGLLFEIADARRMFRLTDDLVFEEADDPDNEDADLLGPVQIFNEGAGGLLNRQSNGTVSWCAIAQPVVNDVNATEVDSYKFHVLVFKDRVTDATAPESAMAAATVTDPTTPQSPLSTVTINEPLNDDIRRNDWVMLINQITTPTSASTSITENNIAFARISNFDSNDAAGTALLTLDGPDFPFTPDMPVANATYIVHLRDVVSVFTRTIKLETLSGWNISN